MCRTIRIEPAIAERVMDALRPLNVDARLTSSAEIQITGPDESLKAAEEIIERIKSDWWWSLQW